MVKTGIMCVISSFAHHTVRSESLSLPPRAVYISRNKKIENGKKKVFINVSLINTKQF